MDNPDQLDPHEIPDDEIEIVDLNMTDQNQPTASKPRQRISLKSRFTPQQRKRQVLVTISLVTGLFCLLLWSILPVRQMLTSHDQTTTPISGQNQKLFYFQRLPSWGTFFLDGRKIANAPENLADRPLPLPVGVHDLEWRAAPFQPLSCRLHIPVEQTIAANSCRIQTVFQSNSTVNAFQILFPGAFSLKDLPEAPRHSLVQSAQHLLDTLAGTTELSPGERFADARGHVQVTTVPVQVKQQFVLDSETQMLPQCIGVQFDRSCFIAGQDCRLFCTLDWPAHDELSAQTSWHVAAIFHPVWTYTSTHHTQVVQGGVQFVTLSIAWIRDHWRVAFHQQGESSFDDPNCITTIGIIAANPAYRSIPLSWAYVSGLNRADGCLAVAIPGGSTFTDPSLFSIARSSGLLLFERCGVLLTAGSDAQARWPSLPTVTVYERQLALNILKQSAFIS